MDTRSLRIECEAVATLDVDQIQEFQGNLKSLSRENYERFRNQLLELGFSEPISVWKDPDGVMRCLNGHQRTRTLKEMRREGIEIPPIPVSWIHARTLKEAKKKVLALASQYGKVEDDGLYEFLNDAQITAEELGDFHFPDIDMEEFRADFLEDKNFTPATEAEQGRLDVKAKVVCPNCQHEFSS